MRFLFDDGSVQVIDFGNPIRGLINKGRRPHTCEIFMHEFEFQPHLHEPIVNYLRTVQAALNHERGEIKII